MIKIDTRLMKKVSLSARRSKRKRANHNFHRCLSDPLQRMLNALEPETYIRAHKHQRPDKREAFLTLRGRVLAVEFDSKGRVRDSMVLDPKKGDFGAEIPARAWHTIIALEPGSVIYEIKDGPYRKVTDKVFAPWAPEEGSGGAQEFNATIFRTAIGARRGGRARRTR